MTLSHSERVLRLTEQIRSISSTGDVVKIVKDDVSHFVPNPQDNSKKRPKVSIKGFNNILEIDDKNKTCAAEPGVTFSALVKETLKHGLIPRTVPELKTITIGGAVSGCSVESMSYKYGGFHDSCLEYEIVTGKGDVITATPNDKPDIFNMIHGSYGTLGVITKMKFKLIPAKPFVKMEYVTFGGFDSFWSFLKDRCLAKDNDFVDAIIHSREKFTVCLGNMVDTAPYTSNYTWLNIFYKSTRNKKEDYLSIYDYFFRYDTECHWLSRTVPLLENKLTRLLVGKFVLGSTNLIKWSKRLAPLMKIKRRPEVVVDVFIPSGRFKEFFDWYRSDYSFYPLWIVPYAAPDIYPWIDPDYAKKMGGSFFIDCAVYGKKNNDQNIDYSEVLEKKTIELNGIKTLISRNHFDKGTFWKVYNKKKFDEVKKTTDPTNLFSDTYTKLVLNKN